MDLYEVRALNFSRRDDEMCHLAGREDIKLFVFGNSTLRPALS
jgi:hypothetical protein